MSRLDSLIKAARSTDSEWTESRDTELLQSMLKERARRVTRSRLLRRSAILTSIAATVAVVFLKGISAPVASAIPSPTTTPTTTDPQQEVIAASGSGDGGYSRD